MKLEIETAIIRKHNILAIFAILLSFDVLEIRGLTCWHSEHFKYYFF
jgi:hypothetical protein